MEEEVAGYPIVLSLSGQPCLVVGGGPVAFRKVRGLARCGARVRIVAKEAIPDLRAYAEKAGIQLLEKPYESEDLQGVMVAVSAANDALTNEQVARDARSRGIFVNVVDRAELCTFTAPAVLRRGDLTIAVSTGGKSPALAKSIRDRLEQQFGEKYGPYVDFLGRTRRWTRDQFPDDPAKRHLASRRIVELNLVDRFAKDEESLAEEEAKQCISSL